MSALILGSQQSGQMPGGNGRNIQWGQFKFNGTGLTGSIPSTLRRVESVFVQPIRAAGAGIVQQMLSPTISATVSFTQRALRGGTVTQAKLTTATTVATDAANIWTVGLINVSNSNAVIINSATAANSNNSTGGSAFTTVSPRAFTLSAVAADILVAAGDVLKWTFTKASSAADIVVPEIDLVIGNDDEVEWIDTPSQGGFQLPTAGTLSFLRRALNPTSDLPCSYFAIGF